MTEKIDVFFCTMQRVTPLRARMRDLCLRRWQEEKTARVHILRLETDYPGNNPTYQKVRRMLAEERAITDPYVVADDDCYPSNAQFLGYAVEILKRHDWFTILSLMPRNAHIQPWRPHDYDVATDHEVMEHVDVGGIRVCRPMPFKEWPAQTRPGYDREQCEAIREAGWKVGYFKEIEMLHLGEGDSSVW